MKNLFILSFLLISCTSKEAKVELNKFDQTSYVKTSARDRIQTYSFDFYSTSIEDVKRHALKSTNTDGQMTAVYYFHQNDRQPQSGFSTFTNIFAANDFLYSSNLIDDWKYAYLHSRNGDRIFVDCTLPKEERYQGLCKGD